MRVKPPSINTPRSTRVPLRLASILCGVAILAGLSGCETLEAYRKSQERKALLVKAAAEYQAFTQDSKNKRKIYRNDELLSELTPSNSRIVISLGKQRAYVFLDDVVVIDTYVSSGKRGFRTPKGQYKVLDKLPENRSNLYGKIYDGEGNILKSDADTRVDEAPEEGEFVGALMPYWMRLTRDGVGMHVGRTPRYAASHGCVRVPRAIQPLIYKKSKVGTPVAVTD